MLYQVYFTEYSSLNPDGIGVPYGEPCSLKEAQYIIGHTNPDEGWFEPVEEDHFNDIALPF